MAAVLWQRVRRQFLVVARTDSCGADGVRRVVFDLATPAIPDLELPDVPDAQPLTTSPLADDGNAFDYAGGAIGLPGTGGGYNTPPWSGGAVLPDCCEDPPIEVTDVEPRGGCKGPLLLYLYDDGEAAAILVVMNTTSGLWEYLADAPGGLIAESGQLVALTATLIAYRDAAAGGVDYGAAETIGTLWLSEDGGETWTENAGAPSHTIGSPPVTIDPMPIYTWAELVDGDIWARFGHDFGGTEPGGESRLWVSTDTGATWAIANTPFSTTSVGQRMAVNPDVPDDMVHVTHGRVTGDPEYPGDITLRPWVGGSSYAAWTWNNPLDFDVLYAPIEDNPALVEWGNTADRVILALHERAISDYGTGAGTDQACIEIADLTWGPVTTTPTNVARVYSPEVDRGRPIGLVRKAGTDVVFCGWEDGTVLRSTDDGETWAEMTQMSGAPFASASALAYDQDHGCLWVVGKNGAGAAYVQVWSDAAGTATVADGTRNLNSVGSIATPRTAGHLGMVVRA